MKFPSVNLNLYKSFIAVYDAKNMSKAAEALELTTSSISYNIKVLERQLAVKLFSTNPRGVIATKDADELYKHLVQAFSIITNAEQSIKTFDAESKSTIRVGCASHFAHYILLPLFKEFREKYPNITFQIINESQRGFLGSVEMLKKKEMDIFITAMTDSLSDDFAKIKIKDLEYDFFATKEFLKKHNITSKITKTQFIQLPVIAHSTSDRFQKLSEIYGLKKDNVVFATSPMLTYQMMLEGMGITCFIRDATQTADFPKDKVVVLSIEGTKPFSRTLTCAYNADIASKAVLTFIKDLQTHL
jgi:DNA-binding transcriptional LysR family regulator